MGVDDMAAALAILLSVLADLVKLAFQMGDAPTDLSAVHLQLGFAGAAHADAARGPAGPTTGLTGQVGPGPGQPGQTVFVLGQLHLHRALLGAGVAGEDVQDQGRAVQDLDLAQGLLHLPLLAGGELVVEDHHVGPGLGDQGFQLHQLAGAHEGGRVGGVEVLGEHADHGQPGRVGQEGQLGHGILQGEDAGVAADLHAHQHGQLFGLEGVDQPLVVPQVVQGRAILRAEIIHLVEGGSAVGFCT